MLQGIEYAKQQAECWKQERGRNVQEAAMFCIINHAKSAC